MAKIVKRYYSSVSRELKRQSPDKYKAEEAQKQYLKSKNCGRKTKKKVLINVIEKHLKLTRSPEQISETVLKGVVSFKTIYRWLDEGVIFNGKLSYLGHKGKRHLPRETRGRFNAGTYISKRPKVAKSRQIFGHWELDTVEKV